jgi:flagellar assembly protein FliH
MPSGRVLRGAPYGADSVLIGDAPFVAVPRPAWRMAPPPPPPPVEPDEDDFTDADATEWAPSPWSDDAEPEPPETSPFDEEAQRKLAEAEQLLADANAEAARLLAQAQRQAAELVASAEEDLEHARAEALEMHQQAEAEAARIRAEAQEGRAAVEQAGREEGLAAGRADGLELAREQSLAQAREEVAEQLSRATELAESAAVDRRELLHNAEAEVVRLALQVARKVLDREVHVDSTVVNRIAEAALQYVAVDGVVRLRVNPEDHMQLSQYWKGRHGTTEADRTYDIVADPEVPRGGVVIDTRAGTVDARLETQLDEIARSIGVMGDEMVIAE